VSCRLGTDAEDHHYRLDALGMSSYRPVLRRLNVDLTSSATKRLLFKNGTRYFATALEAENGPKWPILVKGSSISTSKVSGEK